MDDKILINESEASDMVRAIDDSTVRNLVMLGIAEARMQTVQLVPPLEGHRRPPLPESPFDMKFFTLVLVSMFNKREIVKGILDGRDLAQASGWDI